MRIGIDIRSLAERQYSGISEYTLNLLRHLFELDSHNEYILFSNAAKDIALPEFNYPNVSKKIYHYPNKLFNIATGIFKIFRIDEMMGGVDVMLIPNFLFTNASKKTKQIIIVHDLSFDLYPQFFTLKKRLWHRLISPKKLCQNAKKVIAISKNTKRDIVDYYKVPEQSVSVVYPGISEIFFQQMPDSYLQIIRSKYNLPENYLFYLGNLEPRKNVLAIIQAFELIEEENLHLVIVGGNAWKYKEIYDYWQKSNKKERILFLGYVDAQDKPGLYHMANVFIYPSIYEGFGLPPVEAMAAGTPVVTSFSSSLPEAVGKAGLLVDPYNYNEISAAIQQILADPKLREELRQRGFEKSNHFHWEKAAREILTIIESV